MLKDLGWSLLVMGGMLAIMESLGVPIDWENIKVFPFLMGWAALWIASPEER